MTDRIEIDEVTIEEVGDFCYLGSVVSSNSSSDMGEKTLSLEDNLEKIWKSSA